MRQLTFNELVNISGGGLISHAVNGMCGCVVGAGLALVVPDSAVNIVIGTGAIFTIFGALVEN